MDNYPENLAPKFDEGGGVITPFDEWWPMVKDEFPGVPENVAKYWLHQHWGQSPYSYLPSRDYDFELVDWKSDGITQFRSCWCNFDPAQKECREKGEQLINSVQGRIPNPTAVYMDKNGEFPAPIIVLDNRDGHLCEAYPSEKLPVGLILVEGHNRLNIALHLRAIGRLKDTVKIWFMTRR